MRNEQYSTRYNIEHSPIATIQKLAQFKRELLTEALAIDDKNITRNR